MGWESFQIILKTQIPLNNIINIINSISGVLNNSSFTLANEQYSQYRKKSHIIEIKVEESFIASQISCRFALCHPISIDEIFIDFIKKMAQSFSLDTEIEIVDEVPNNLPEKFIASKMDGFEKAVKKAISVKRKYWISDFGAEQATLTTSEALEKFCYS